MIIILYANKHVYHVRMADIIGERVEVKELIDKKEIEKYKCMDSILKIFKN